jgi:predicted O-methyltransferase YrrM
MTGAVAEIGVALGDFSEFLLEKLKPSRFVALDNFEMDNWADIWGASKKDAFRGLSHVDFYKQRIRYRPEVEIVSGLSHETLPRYADATFDLIYIDANHTYEAVKADTEIAKTKIKRDGILMFNDYIMYDHNAHFAYGVVQAVNELVVAEDWRVIGIGLNPQMYCDIAIRRGAA